MRHCIEIFELGYDYGGKRGTYDPPGSIIEQLDALVKKGAKIEHISRMSAGHDTSGPAYSNRAYVVYEDGEETKG